MTSQQQADEALQAYWAAKKIRARHGMTKSPEYKAWLNMKGRCSNPKVSQFKDYGGRGIKLCERWETFQNFYADMGPKPSLTHSIDRQDNDGDYEPSNCKWATRQEQDFNKRNNSTLAGRVFGRLTVVARIDGRRWKCLCSCGVIKSVTCSNLHANNTQSCGCLKREMLKAVRSGRRAPRAA